MFITSQTWGVLTCCIGNFDYDPSSTTSIGSLHGTGISIFHCPTKENLGISRSVTPVGEACYVYPMNTLLFPLCL